MTISQPASQRGESQSRKADPTRAQPPQNQSPKIQPSKTELDRRYGRIGISAVAAAIPFQNELRGPDCAQAAPTTYAWSLAVAE
jgi:hypothetical protein